MKIGIDEYNHLDSPLHRWDPRCKLIGLIILIFAFSFVRDLRMLAVMVALTAIIFVVSRLPFSFLLSRLRYPSIFLLILVLILPFLSGETVLASIGPLDLREEGLLSALLIAVRFISILTIGIVLFGTAPLLTSIKAMRALGLPGILADMTFLFLRYLHEIGGDLRRMQISMTLRGFRQDRFSARALRILAWLSGSILVRSYERSDSVYKAMILRGYGHGPRPRDEFKARTWDFAALGFIVLLAAVFVTGDILYGHQTYTLIRQSGHVY